MLLYQLRHVDIDSDDQSGDFNVNDKNRSGQQKKLEYADLQVLLDNNPFQNLPEN